MIWPMQSMRLATRLMLAFAMLSGLPNPSVAKGQAGAALRRPAVTVTVVDENSVEIGRAHV